MLLKRYGNINHILSLELNEGWDLFLYAREQEKEEQIYKRWLHFQHIDYEEFKEQLIEVATQTSKDETVDEILDKVKNILDDWR